MLNKKQKAILRAYGKAQLSLMSHAVAILDYDDGEEDYLALSCIELFKNYRQNKGLRIVNWQHPHTSPCWSNYGIGDNDFSDYMHRRFPLLYPDTYNNEN